jgi:alkanesulfonate monooxygenase SsuD/methylene tetrahydromethanopterin reductase-like flavin-dependent oxidoreductase (luciferase family)
VTASVALGALGSPVDRRPPAVLAKIATTLDALSAGRAVVALAPPAGGGEDPVGQVAEAIVAFELVASGEPASLTGRHVHLDGAVSRPPAVHREGIPLLVVVDAGRADAVDLATAGDGWVAPIPGAGAGLAAHHPAGDVGDPPVSLAVLDAGSGPDPAAVEAGADRAKAAGFTGIVVPVDPADPSAVERVTATGRRLAG